MEALANRLHAFELLVIPYTVAHYRLLREVAAVTGKMPAGRLPIYLADTLAAPRDTKGLTPHLGFMAGPIVGERRAADKLKRETPIIAIIGNPPYRRLQAGEEAGIISGWDGGFWDDLKQPVRNAGWGNELNTFPELSVAFWRWCLWKIFESEGAPGRGVVCLITNRTFLAGHPYAGLRQMLRQRFDRLEILDLRGDLRGARPAAVTQDEGVFNIETGVCILTAMATNTERPQGALAEVFYADAWRHGAFTEAQKLAWVEQATAASDAISFVHIEGTDLTDFVPAGFQGLDWASVDQCFSFSKSGVKTQRDELVYSFTPGRLENKIDFFLKADPSQAWVNFFPSSEVSDANESLSVSPAALNSAKRTARVRFERARSNLVNTAHIQLRCYRPFDRRFLYTDSAFVSRHGPELNAAWGDTNGCLYAMPSGTGAGPAIWVHGLLPDYHAFSGRGGYAFPLWDRRHGPAAHNLKPALLAGLGAVYGRAIMPEAAFNAIIALLSASSYTMRFAWDLEEVFPHIPFPAEASVFEQAAQIGAEIAALQSFARAPGAGFRSAKLVGQATGRALKIPSLGSAFLAENDDFGRIPLLEDQSLRLANVPKRVWDFAVSGYRVLYRWLKVREGEALADIQRDACDIAWRIEELLHWTDATDAVLEAALQRPLTKTVLGLAAPPAQPGDRLEF
jgi:predicted helicase